MATDNSIPADVAADLALSGLLPSGDVVAKIYDGAARLASLECKIAELKDELQKLDDDRSRLATKVLPDLFDQVQTDKFGVPGWNADLVLEAVVHAAIKKEWPDEQQEAGFLELERLGEGDLVKVRMTIEFDKKELDVAYAVANYLRQWNEFQNRTIRLEKTIPWNTLTKVVKDLVRKRVPMDLTKLGAQVFRHCKLQWRKDRSGAARMVRLDGSTTAGD